MSESLPLCYYPDQLIMIHKMPFADIITWLEYSSNADVWFLKKIFHHDETLIILPT